MLVVAQLIFSQSFVAEAPSHVSVGEQFRLTYTINTQNVSGFRVGKLPDAFEVLMGPNTSSRSSYQMVNGHTSSTSSITYTYILYANKKGEFTIPGAHVNVGGKSVVSNALKVNVSGSARNGSSQGGHSSEPRVQDAGASISGSDLFVKVNASKRRVSEQEPVMLTYKIYTLVGLTSVDGKMPDLKGFHTQEVQLPQQKSFKVENVNGKPYRVVTLRQYVMFPQITGKLEIPSITFEGIVVQQNRNVDPFEAFFNGGSGYIEVKKKIKAPGLTIQVDPLPARPANFSGGVGSFDISAQLNKTEIKANDPVTLRVIVSGTGNLKLIKEPKVVIPSDFDKYDAKITDKTKLTANGVEGNMIYDFLIVPRHQGKYTIPAIEFTYYDTQHHKYTTKKTQPFSLDVAKGAGGSGVSDFSAQEDLKQLNKDIRYIKCGKVELHSVDSFFFGSLAYLVSLVALLLIFISLFVMFRHRAIENANIGKLRGKNASRVATKRLKKAGKLMREGNNSLFYDEVLRALWGYVSDKLSIPVEKLSRENISQCLTERNTDNETIALFLQALDECEFERYAPGDVKGNMGKTFEAAMTAIMRIENVIKKGKAKGFKAGTTGMLIFFCLLAWAMPAHSITKANADSAYANQQYQQAIKDYEELLTEGVSAEIYYNLGNAYYRTDNITRAVLNYERALLLSPGDRDIRFNLQMARSKTIDKITPESEMFFFTWYHALVNLLSVDGWAYMSLAALAMVIILLLIYLFASRIWMRKIGFFGGMLFVVVFVLSNVFAFQQQHELVNRTNAIIISTAVPVKSTPAQNGTDLFILHEGTKVDIVDDAMQEWKKVRVADGKEGWLKTSQVERI